MPKIHLKSWRSSQFKISSLTCNLSIYKPNCITSGTSVTFLDHSTGYSIHLSHSNRTKWYLSTCSSLTISSTKRLIDTQAFRRSVKHCLWKRSTTLVSKLSCILHFIHFRCCHKCFTLPIHIGSRHVWLAAWSSFSCFRFKNSLSLDSRSFSTTFLIFLMSLTFRFMCSSSFTFTTESIIFSIKASHLLITLGHIQEQTCRNGLWESSSLSQFYLWFSL